MAEVTSTKSTDNKTSDRPYPVQQWDLKRNTSIRLCVDFHMRRTGKRFVWSTYHKNTHATQPTKAVNPLSFNLHEIVRNTAAGNPHRHNGRLCGHFYYDLKSSGSQKAQRRLCSDVD